MDLIYYLLCVNQLDNDAVRMWTAIALLRGPHNELHNFLEEKSRAYWSTLPKP